MVSRLRVYRPRGRWRRVGSVIHLAAAALLEMASLLGRLQGLQRLDLGHELGIGRCRGYGQDWGCELVVSLVELGDESGLDFAGAVKLTL